MARRRRVFVPLCGPVAPGAPTLTNILSNSRLLDLRQHFSLFEPPHPALPQLLSKHHHSPAQRFRVGSSTQTHTQSSANSTRHTARRQSPTAGRQGWGMVGNYAMVVPVRFAIVRRNYVLTRTRLITHTNHSKLHIIHTHTYAHTGFYWQQILVWFRSNTSGTVRPI